MVIGASGIRLRGVVGAYAQIFSAEGSSGKTSLNSNSQREGGGWGAQFHGQAVLSHAICIRQSMLATAAHQPLLLRRPKP